MDLALHPQDPALLDATSGGAKMTIDEIKKWMLESSGFPVTQANAEYLERFQAIAFQAGAASRDAEIAKLKSVPMKYRRMAFNAQLQDEVTRLEQENDELLAQIKQKDAEITELVAALETVIANAPEPYCAITRAVDAQCRAALAKVSNPKRG